MTKRKIFDYLVEKKIYLNYYFLNKVHSKMSGFCYMTLDNLINELDLNRFKTKKAKNKAVYQIDKTVLSKHRKAVSIPVLQIDLLKDVVIARHSSIYQAGKSLGKKGYGDIARVCRGTLNHAYGYRWRFTSNKTK